MNLLIVGGGKGSWTMRGVQLGAALGARVTSTPSETDWRWADLVVLVKNHGARQATQAHRFGVPIVWDAIDFWRQPADHGVSERVARDLLAHAVEHVNPVLTIGSTDAMASACGGVYLPHHAWDGLRPTPARPHMQVVGYQGNPVYLGAWARRLEDACARRGWQFVVNPSDLTAVDLLVALRDGSWDGWVCRAWKSGVKLVNAIAAGRPILTQDSAAWRELEPDGSLVETSGALDAALDQWGGVEARQMVVDRALGRAHVFTVDAVARQYRAILATRRLPCAV